LAVSEVAVRRVRADEGARIRAVRLSALAEEDFRGHFLREEEQFTPDDWATRAKRGAESEDFATFVGASGPGLVAIADGYVHEATVEVGGMWVQPDLRRRGIGRRLLDAVIEWAAIRGASRLDLTVVTTNVPALVLYERAGFIAVGEPQPAKTVSGVTLQRMGRQV
jgi:GNAT superfamily N-acetyltransferase